MSKALLIIDIQNDYFPGGAFTLWNTQATLENIQAAIRAARDKGIPVVHIQHVVDSRQGTAPFFNEGTDGVKVHAGVLEAAPDAPVVVKAFADSFEKTALEATLSRLGIDELLVCGMMTHNCVTHTAISKAAEKYEVSVLSDCCTTVDETIHALALHALSTRVRLVPWGAALESPPAASSTLTR